MAFRAVYYRAADGSQPVRDFVRGLPVRAQVMLNNQLDRLNELTESTPHLPFPYSSQVEGELRELRCHVGSDLYRVLYRRSENLIVLLHIFAKRGRKVPKTEIRVAARRWDDFKRRMDEQPRGRPRAAGRDAP
jgi:phage-related protein